MHGKGGIFLGADKNRRNAYIAAVCFSVAVGFSFLGIKTCTPFADTLTILTHRYNWALIAVLVFILYDRLRGHRIEIKGKPKRNLFITALFYILFMAIQTFGLRFATSIESAILFAIVPIIVKIIASIFLGEKSGIMQTVFVCISVAAVIAMIVIGATDIRMNIWAMLILSVSSICMALSNVFMRYVREQYRPIEITAMISLMGFVVFNAAYIVRGISQGTLNQYFDLITNVKFEFAVFYLGTACILLSSQLMAYVLRYLEAVKGTIFGNVSTAISIIAGVVVLGEPLKAYHIICAALIVVGVLGISLWPEKKTDRIE